MFKTVQYPTHYPEYFGSSLHLVVRGQDHYIMWHTIEGSDNSLVKNWTLVTGLTPSKPVLVSKINSDETSLVVRSMNDLIYYNKYNAMTDTRDSWSSISGSTIDGPCAVILGGKPYLGVR